MFGQGGGRGDRSFALFTYALQQRRKNLRQWLHTEVGANILKAVLRSQERRQAFARRSTLRIRRQCRPVFTLCPNAIAHLPLERLAEIFAGDGPLFRTAFALGLATQNVTIEVEAFVL